MSESCPELMAVSNEHTETTTGQTQVSLREQVRRVEVNLFFVLIVFICEIHVTVTCHGQTSRPSGREVDDAKKVCALWSCVQVTSGR